MRPRPGELPGEFVFCNVCMQVNLVNILTYVPILSDIIYTVNIILARDNSLAYLHTYILTYLLVYRFVYTVVTIATLIESLRPILLNNIITTTNKLLDVMYFVTMLYSRQH